MRKGLPTFKVVPQMSKHHSAQKNPLSQDAQKPLSQHAQKKEVMMLTRWAMSSKSKNGTPKREPCAPNLYCQLQFSSVSSNYQRWAPILNPDLQLSTVSSNSEPCAPVDPLPNSQKPPNWIELSKTSRDNVQKLLSFVIIYYYILYVFLFLLYIILFYMYFIFIICYFILYKLP